jgi:hypothetical protein
MTESVWAVDDFLSDFFQQYGWFTEKAIETIEYLRPFGYVAFEIVSVLILVGFAIRKGYLSTIGSIALYFPVFGHFACTMFFLAGIGVTRALWLPLMDCSPFLFTLGNVVITPFFLLVIARGGRGDRCAFKFRHHRSRSLGLLFWSLDLSLWEV